MKKYHQDKDFLFDNEFIMWRLFRTEEQDLYWKRFADEHPECRDAIESAIHKFNAVKLNNFELAGSEQEKLYRSILTNARRHRTSRRRMMYWSAAASIALLMVSSLMFLQPFNKPAREDAGGAEVIIGQTMTSDNIQLISGEKVVELKQNAQIALHDGRISVVEESDVSEMSLVENAINKLIVPSGRRSSLRLPDGTKLWLNSGTELVFPSGFAGDTREITMKGEIYIEVAKGRQPFYVNTSQFRVRVHGTKFNISAYNDNEENSVALVEGSVEVTTTGNETILLTPNEKAAVNAGVILKETVNVDEYISWKDGVLIFNQTPISEVLKKIGRYYNVHFENLNDNELSAKTCTGKLFLSEDFEEIMVSLSTLSATQYVREGDVIRITE